MALIDPGLGIKLVFILGFTNVIGLLLVFLTCRCIPGLRIVERLWKYAWYRKFYSKHCYFWWIFFASVLLHSIVALLVFGNPL